MSKALLKQLGLHARPNIAREALRDDVDASTINNGLVLRLAEQAHEANRVLCLSNGDASQVLWADTDKETKVSAIKGVLRILQDDSTTHEASHASWMENKLANGWTYGENKDEAAKTHPCLVPYDQLPLHEQLKDNLFVTIVETGLGISQNGESQRSHHGEPDMTDTDPEVAAVAAEAFALMTSLETLEAASAVLNAAPDEQVNETNAALINTMVGSAIGEDQADRLMPSAESFSLGSKRVLAAYAREGLGDKIKEGTKAIWDKIVEMIQKFWEWLTLNHKRVRTALVKATDVIKDMPSGGYNFPYQAKYSALVGEFAMTAKSVIKIADNLSNLSDVTASFISASFKNYGGHQPSVAGDLIGSIDKDFSEYKTSGKDNEFLLYSNIGGRELRLTVNLNRINNKAQAFDTSLQPAENKFQPPLNVVLNKYDINLMLSSAIKLIDKADDNFINLSSASKDLKRSRESTADIATPLEVLKAYNKCIGHFIDGIFTQALRHGAAVSSLAGAFIKTSNKATPTD